MKNKETAPVRAESQKITNLTLPPATQQSQAPAGVKNPFAEIKLYNSGRKFRPSQTDLKEVRNWWANVKEGDDGTYEYVKPLEQSTVKEVSLKDAIEIFGED